MKIVFLRYYVVDLSESIPPSMRNLSLSEPGVYLGLVDERHAVCATWIYLESSSLDQVTDSAKLKAIVSDLDAAAYTIRDRLQSICGKYGRIGAMDAFSVKILLDDKEVIEDIKKLSNVRWPRKIVVHIVNHVEMSGIGRPVPVFPEAAHLLARAEGERDRFRSIVDYTKILENAFGMHDGSLIIKLEAFFKHAPISYTKTEIKKWFSLRGQDAHAKSIANFDEAHWDIVLARLRQAAIDVSHNKRDWGDRRAIRQDRIRLNCWYGIDGRLYGLAKTKIEFVFLRELVGGIRINFTLEDALRDQLNQALIRIVRTTVFQGSDVIFQVVAFADKEGHMTVRELPNYSSFVEYLWDFGDEKR